MTGQACLHIALLNTLYAPYRVGGAEKSVKALAEALVADGHRVDVITLHEGADEIVSINGVTVHRLKADHRAFWPFDGRRYSRSARWRAQLHDLWNRRMYLRVQRKLAEVSPQLLHTNNLLGFSVSVWRAAASLRIPILHTARDYYLLHPDSVLYANERNVAPDSIGARCWSFLRRRAARDVDSFVGISQFVHDIHRKQGFFGDARTVAIHNGIDVNANECEPLAEARGLRLGYLGRIEAFKGVEHMFRGIEQSGACDSIELVLAGEGRSKYIRRLAARYAGVNHRFIGYAKPDELFAQVDGLVVPSLWREPFGRVVVEANAHGVPVLASRMGGLPEIVEDGATGYLFDSEDPDALAGLLERLAGDGLEVSASRCRAHAARFTVAPMARRYVEEYRLLLRRRSVAGERGERVAQLPA